jgi:hypothetical protein
MRDDQKKPKPSLARLGSHRRDPGEDQEAPRGRMVFRIVPAWSVDADGGPATLFDNGIPVRTEYEVAFVPGPDMLQ